MPSWIHPLWSVYVCIFSAFAIPALKAHGSYAPRLSPHLSLQLFITQHIWPSGVNLIEDLSINTFYKDTFQLLIKPNTNHVLY